MHVCCVLMIHHKICSTAERLLFLLPVSILRFFFGGIVNVKKWHNNYVVYVFIRDYIASIVGWLKAVAAALLHIVTAFL